MACQIKRNSNGAITQVLAPNGKDSILYRDIVNNLSNPQTLAQVKQDPYVSMVLGTEYIKGTDVSEVGLAAWSKAYSAGFINQFGDWKTQTIANTDINGEPNVDVLFPSVQVTTIGSAIFDKQLAQKIQAKLQALYPEIKLNITNNPVWEKGDNILNQEQFNLEVNYRLKTTKVVLDNYNKIRQWESNKSINQDTLYKKIGELGISKQQLDLLKNSEGNTVEEKLASFTANYSYTVEINTAKQKTENIKQINATYFEVDGIDYTEAFGSWFKNEGTTKISYDEYKKALDKYNQQNVEEKPTQHYSNLTVPGGTNYRENEIATPAITPSIKGHAQFSTDKGIGWFRNDDLAKDARKQTFAEINQMLSRGEITIKEYQKLENQEGIATKTRRILEVQSDLFQKGRDKQDLAKVTGQRDYVIGEDGLPIYKNKTIENIGYEKQNQFLQLLNKDNNWVTFFIKSIIQDSAKKGYEKVLFPSGDTASKVEGHTTLEEFKKQKEDRVDKIEKEKNKLNQYLKESDEYITNTLNWSRTGILGNIEEIDLEINQIKQELERVEREGFGALKPVYNFYETTVANVLKKQGYNPILITDEYGNTWNEVNINQARDLSEILLQRNKANQIIGQANIKALTVLIDAVNQKQDTLPHEYAHHYIAWYRNTPIVQEAIKKWGSEEALVQAIGEQVVKQKGEAYNWWKNFVRWILNQFNKLSTLQKEELAKILTDAFLTRQDLNIQPDIQASASFKLIQLDEYTKYPQKYSEEVERVVRLIENKLRIKEKGFTGKVSNKFISKENYLADVLKNLLSNIGLPESITSLEELKTQLDNGDVVKYVKSQYDFYKEQASIAKEDLDNLNAKTRTLNSYLKVQDLSGYSKEQQSLIIKSFPALFEELGRYKSKKQALEHYKRIVNTLTFLNKTLSSNIIKNKYFINQAKLNKFENLVNYNTLSPEDFNYRIYRVVENELNRRSDFFSSPKMQEVVLAEKEKIAKRNYENSVKGILERFSNDKNTVSGKIAEVFLRHPKTLSAIKSENIQRSIFGFAGGKWTGNGELEINYRNDTSLKHILLHELTHHFTVPYIYTYLKNYSDVEKYIGFIERFPSKSELEENIQYSFQSLTSEEVKNISKLEDIYIHVLKLHKEGKLKFTNYEFSANPEYGLENFYEFISEVISNPYFASEIAKQPSLYNKKSNLLKDIIDMIFKMFGVNNPSLLDDIYSLFEETFLDKDVKYAFRDTVGGSITFPLETQPAVKEGVDFVFEQNPELASIGTQEQYSEYLDTVFPDSMVKQIMYHGSPIGKIAEIDKRFAITYWSTTLDYVRSSNLWKNNITQAILNIRNPLFTNKLLASAPPEVTEFLSPAYTSEEYDSVIGVDAGQQLVGGKTIAVKNKQVDTHILGSKKDIEGFKKFVKGTQQVSGMSSILNLINMKRWTQTKNNCPKL